MFVNSLPSSMSVFIKFMSILLRAAFLLATSSACSETSMASIFDLCARAAKEEEVEYEAALKKKKKKD